MMKILKFLVLLIVLFNIHNLYGYRLLDLDKQKTTTLSGITREIIELRTNKPGLLKLSSSVDSDVIYLMKVQGVYDRKKIRFISKYNLSYYPEKLLGLKKGNKKIKIKRIETASVKKSDEKGMLISFIKEKLDKNHSYLLYTNLSRSKKTESLTFTYTPVSQKSKNDKSEKLKENDIKQFRFIEGRTLKEYDFRISKDGYLQFTLGNVPSSIEQMYFKLYRDGEKKVFFQKGMDCKNGEGKFSKLISSGNYTLKITPNYGDEYIDIGKNTSDEMFLLTEFREFEDQDKYEPNDSIKSAVPIKFGEFNQISIFPYNDKDYFVFTLDKKDTCIDIFFSKIPQKVYLHYTVMDSSGTKIHEAKLEKINSFTIGTPGKYYIEFKDMPRKNWDKKDSDSQVFRFMLNRRRLIDANEINNSQKTATVLRGLSGNISGTFEKHDSDYFKLDMKDGYYTVSLHFTDVGTYTRFEFYKNNELLKQSDFRNTLNFQRAIYSVEKDVFWFRLIPQNSEFQHSSYNLTYSIIPADGNSAFLPCSGQELKEESWISGTVGHRWDRDFYSFVPSKSGGYYIYSNNNHNLNIKMDVFTGNKFLMQGSNDSYWNYGPTMLFRDLKSKDFTLDFKIFPRDNDGLGIIFRRQDSKNFYSFRMDLQEKKLEFLIMENGKERKGKVFKDLLYIQNFWNKCSLKVKGESFELMLNGKKVSVSDSTFNKKGSLGMFAASSENLGFDDISLKSESGSIKVDFENEKDFGIFQFIDKGWWDIKVGGIYSLFQDNNDGKGRVGPIALLKDISTSDFSLSFLCKTFDDDGLGVVFRYKDEKNYYAYRFDNQSRRLELLAVKNGTEKVLKEFKGVLYNGRIWNVMRLEVKGTDFSMYCNDKKVGEFSDSTFSESGRIGFLCSYCDDTFFTKIDLNYSGINLNIDFKNKQDLEKFDLVNGGRWYVKYDDKYFNSDYKTAAHLVNLEKGIKYDLSFRFEQADVLQNLKYDFIIFPADRSTEDPLEVSISDLKNDQIYSAKNSELFLKYKFDSPGSYRILVDKTEWGLKIPGIRLFKAADMDYPKKNILFLSGGDKAYDWTLRYPEFNYKRINAGTSEEKSYLNLDFANFDLVIIDGINNLKQFGLNDRKTYDRLRQKIRSGAKIWLFIRDVAVSKILGIKLKNTWQDNQIIKKDFSDPLMNRIYGDDKGRWHRYENTGYFLDWKEKGYKPLYIPSNDANGAITLKKEIGSGFFLLDTRLLSHSGTYSDDRMIYNILGVKEKFIDVRRLAPNSKTRFFWNDIKIDESGEYYLNFYGLSEKHRICIEISDNRNLRTPTLPGFKKIVMSGNEEAVTLSKNCKKGDKIIVYSTDPILRKNFIQLESVSSTSKKLRTLVLWGEDRYQRKIIEFNDLNADFIDFSDCREHYWWKKIKDYDLVLAIGINRKWQFGLGKKEVQDKIRSYTSRGGKFVLCVTYNREKLEFDGCMFDSEHSQDRIMVKCNPYDSFFDGEKIGLNNWKSSRNNGWLTKVSSSYRTVIMNNGGKPLLVEKKNGKGSIILTSINFLSDGNKFNDVYPFASKLFGLDRKYRHYLSSKSCGIHEFQIPDNFNQLNFHIKSKIPCVFYYKYIQNSNTNEQKSYKKIEADFDVAQDIPIKNYAGLRIEVPCKSSFEYCFKNVSKKPVYMDLFECNPSGFRKTKLKVLYLKGTDGYQTNSHNNLDANPAIDIKKMNWGDCGKEFFQKELSRYEVVIMEGVSGEWEFFNGDSIVKKGIEKFVFGGGTFIFSSPMNCKGKTLLWGTISKKFDRQHNSLKFTKKGESYLDTFYTDNSISWNNSENYSIFSKLPADFTPLIVQKKDSNGVALAVKKIGKGKIYMSTMLFGDSYNFKKLKAVNLLFGLIGNSIPRRISSHKRVDLSEKLSNTDLNSGKYYICFSGNTNNTILWYKLHDKSAGKNYFDFDKKNPEKNRMYFDKWRQIEIHDNSKLSFYFHAKEDTLIESILFSKNKSFYYDMSLIDLKKDIELIKKKSKIVNESEIISVKKGQKIQLVFKIPSINGKTVVSPYFRKKTSFFEPGMYLSSIENPLLLQSDKLFTSVNNDKDILFSLDNVKTDLGFYFFSTFGKLSSDLFIYTVPDDMKDLIKSGSRFPAGVSQAKEAIKTTPVRDPKKFDKNNFIQVYSNCSLTKDFYPSISKEKTGKIVYQYTPNNNMKGKKGESIVHIAMNGFVKKYKGEFVFGDNYWSKNELKYDSAGKNLKLGIRFVKDGKDIKKHVMNLKDGVYKFDIDVTGCKWFDIVFTKLVDEKIVVFSRNMSVEYENGFNFSNGTFKFGRFSGKTDLVPHISGDGTTDISCIKWPSVIECKNDGIKMNLQTLPSRGRKVSLVSRPFELKENWQFELVIDRKINFKIDSFFTIGIKSNSGESRLLVKPETYSVYGSSAVRLMPNDKLDSFVKDKSRLKLKVNYNHRNKYLVFYIDDIPVSYSPQDCSEKWNLFFGMKQNGFWGKKEDKTAGHYRISGMKLCKVRFCDILSHVSKPGYYTHKGIGKIKKGKTYLQVITKNRKLFSLFPEFELKSTGKKTQFKFKPEVEKDLSVIGNIDVLSTSVFDAEKLTVKCGEKKCVVKAVSYYNGYAVRIIPLKNFDSDANVELFYEKRLIKKYRTVLEKVDRLRFKIEMKDMYIGKNDFISILSNSALKKFNIWYSPACIKSFKPITEIEKIDDRTYRISPTFLKEGEYYLKVGGENVFGQSVSQIYKGNSFTVDNTPPARPEIRLESGESGKIDISLDYNDSDVKSVDIFRYEKFHNSSDKKYFVRSLGVNPDNIYTDTPPVLDKDYWYGIIITDLAGNRSKLSEIKKVYSDNTPPAGGKISNVILTSFGKGLIKFRIESQAPENEKKIRYALFDMLRGKKKLLGIFDKKEFEINDLDDGIHAFSVCFSDVAGNISKKNGFDVKGTVDSRGPEFTITSIPKSPFTYGDVKFTFKSNEVLKDDEILVRFVPAAGQSIYLTMKKVDKKTFTSSLKIDDRFRDGRGYFDLTASDIYGNDKLEIKEGRDINIDKTGPVSRIYIKNSKEYYGVTYLNSAEFEFDVIINEKLKAVPKVSFYDKSGKKALDVKLSEIKGYYSMTRFKGNLKLSPEILPEGDYSLRFKGFDVLNNSGDKVSTITKLKVDYTAPAFPNKGTAIFRRKSFIDLKYAVSISPDVRYYLVSRYLSGGDHTKSKPVKLWSDWYRDHDLKKVKDKKVFYRVRSVDRAGNVSEFSKPIETITDFTPPVSPKNLKITKLNDTLKIQFQQPGNEKPFFYNLYYLSVSGDSGSKSFDQIKKGSKLKLSSRDFVFTKKIEGKIWFAVTALDKALNESKPSNIEMIEFDNKPPELKIIPLTLKKGYSLNPRKYSWQTSDKIKLDFNISEKLKSLKATMTSLSSGNVVEMGWDGNSAVSASGLNDGVYVFKISCEDLSENKYSGNCGLYPENIFADTKPPGPFNSIVAKSLPGGKVSFLINHDELSRWDFGIRVEREKSKVFEGKIKVLRSGDGYFEDLPSEDGEFKYTFYAFDGVGNLSKPFELENVISDRSPPVEPTSLTALKKAGIVKIEWKCNEKRKHTFDVYRYGFEVSELTGIEPLDKNIYSNIFKDLPDIDGEYYYYVVSIDETGNRSKLSKPVKVTFKSEIPVATIQLYPAPPLNTDARITLKSSQPLAEIPELKAYFPDGRVEILRLSGNLDTFHSSLKIKKGLKAGTLKFEFKGLGKSGYTGRVINKNEEVEIDFRGPKFDIELSKKQPFTPGKDMDLTLNTSEKLKENPVLIFYEMGGRKENIVLSRESDTVYSGSLHISDKAGEGASFFKIQGIDMAGNTGTRINKNSRVYVDLTPPKQVEKVRCEMKKSGMGLIYFSPSRFENETLDHFNLYIKKLEDKKFFPVGKTFSSPFRYTFNSETVYQIAVTSVDRAGLESEYSRMISIRVDLTPPIAPELISIKVGSEGVFAEGKLKYRGEDDLKEVFVKRGGEKDTITEKIVCKSTGDDTYSFIDVPPKSGKYSYTPYSLNMSSYESTPGSSFSLDYKSLLPECSLRTFPSGKCGVGKIKIMLKVKGELSEEPDIIFVPPGFDPEQAKSILYNIKNIQDAKKYVSKDLTDRGFRIKLKKRGSKFFGELMIEESFGSGRGEFFIVAKTV
ncbi:hypothetical protein KAJ27_14350, partial [bacterium]|nr:hypothetical protein [bacterium]